MFFRSFLAFVLILITQNGFGQSANNRRVVTPFTPRVEDSLGRRVYQWPSSSENSYRRISVQAGYGISPYTSRNGLGNRVVPVTAGTHLEYDGEINSNLGAFQIGFGYDATPWLEVGFIFTYSTNEGFVPALGADLKDSWVTFLPTMRVNWVRSSTLYFYSRLALGVTLGNREAAHSSYTGGAFAWQVSPVGFEYSPTACGIFVEAGYGFSGIVMAGIRFRFGNYKQHIPITEGSESLWKLRLRNSEEK